MDHQLLLPIADFLKQHYAITLTAIISIIFSCIQIAPIKINPWIWIGKMFNCGLRFIGRQINADVISRIDILETTIDGIKKDVRESDEKIDTNRIKEIRRQILDFSNSLNKRARDKEEYEHILFDTYEEYEWLIKKYHMVNGKVEKAMSNINKHYDTNEKIGWN